MFGRSSGCSFVAHMAEFSFVFALGLAFLLLLRLGGWTGVDQLPEPLQAWFEVDPWYLDSLKPGVKVPPLIS